MRLHTFWAQSIGFLIACGLIFSPFGFSQVSKEAPVAFADEQDALETGAVGCAVAALIGLGISYLATGEAVPTSDVPGFVKEYMLDCAAWVITDVAIKIITTEMIGWINTSFDGAPAYVQNLARYTQDTVDNEFGRFIESTTLGKYLCEPFKLDIQIALTFDIGLPPIRRNACTLTDVFNNMEDYNDFVSGDFNKGGWDAWFSITANPQNNPYGAYLIAKDELTGRIGTKVSQNKQELDQGQGFKGFKIQNCYDTKETSPEGVEITFQECDPEETVTPGSAIKGALDGTLDLSNKRLANADELNEMLAAIVSSLVLDAFTKEGGIKGYNADEATGLNLPPITGGGGGGSAKWGCLVDLEEWSPATENFTWNGGNHTMTREGSRAGGGFDYKLKIEGLPPGEYYRRVVFDFDLYVAEITGSALGKFDSILDFARNSIAGQNATYAGYWGIGIAEKVNTYIDNHGGDFFKNRTEWRTQTQNHVTITQDAEAGTVNIKVSRGSEQLADLTYEHKGLDIIDADGKGLFVYLGEHPDWRYENLTATFEGDGSGPFQDGVRGPCAPAGSGGGGADQQAP